MTKVGIGDDPARPGALTDAIGFMVGPVIGVIVGGFREDLVEGLYAAFAVFIVYFSLFLYRGQIHNRLLIKLNLELEKTQTELNSIIHSPERPGFDVLPRILNAKYKHMRKIVIENNPKLTSEHMLFYDSQIEDMIAKIELISLQIVKSSKFDDENTINKQLSPLPTNGSGATSSEKSHRNSIRNSIKKSLKTGPKTMNDILTEVRVYEEIKESLRKKSIVQEYVEGVALNSGGLVELVDFAVRISYKWYFAEMVLFDTGSDVDVLGKFADFSPTIEIKLDFEYGCVYLFKVEGIDNVDYDDQ